MKIRPLAYLQTLTVGFILVFFIGCEGTQSTEIISTRGGVAKGNFSLSIDTLSYIIDSKSSGNSISIQYLEFSEPELAWYNSVNHSIDVYALQDSGLKRRIKLSKEGPNGVGTGNLGMFWLNPDSLIISNKMTLYLLNAQGEVLRNWRLDLEELGGYPDFEITSIKPPVLLGNDLIVSVYPQKSAFKKEHLQSWKNFIRIDLTGQQAPKAFGPLPQYMKENVLGFNYLDKSYVHNEESIVISFHGIKDLFEIDISMPDSLRKIEIEAPEFSTVGEIPGPDKSEFMSYTKHYLLNQSYNGLYFNGEYYLRICQKGITEEELNERSWAKEKIVMIYDNEFNLVKNWPLRSKFGNYMMSAAIEGGFIIKMGSDDENVVNFIRIRIEKTDGEV